MSKTKFTPGPWRVAKDRDGDIMSAIGSHVATCFGSYTYKTVDQIDANAALIAAAPKLYSLLQELIDIEGPQPGTAMWADKVFAALREARGENP